MEVTTAERYASGGEGAGLAAQNLAFAFDETVERLPDELAIRDEERGVEMSWTEVREMARRVAGGLSSLGIAKGDTVALMLNNRWEFIPLDLGCVYLGGVPFSIYQTSSPEQIQYVCEDAEVTVAIVESAFLEVFNKARESLPKLEKVIVIDGEGGDMTLAELEAADP